MTTGAGSVETGTRAHVVIVNWNSGDWLRRCLASLASHGGEGIDRVVVVDNGSSDDSLASAGPGLAVEIIRAGANLGFAKACNIGAADARAPYLLFLNPDAQLHAGTLARVLAFMESPQAGRIGICGIRLADEDGAAQRHCHRFPTWRTFVGAATGLSALFPRWLQPSQMVEFDHLESRPVDHVIGAFYLIRRALFEQLDGFDERFFVYLEDLDLSRRASQAGWATHYLAAATGFHQGGGASEQVKAHRIYYSLSSRLLYGFKHFPAGGACAAAGATLLVEPFARLARALVGGSFREARDTLRAFAWLWRALPKLVAGKRVDP